MTSGNPILDKNLECISKYNPKLKEKLLNLSELTTNIELIETELKEPNLLYDGVPLHSQQGADAEIEHAFDNISNTKMSRHIVFGLGLGYLFKECCEKSKGIVFLYEPNLEILRVTLEIVDFSKELSQKNVFVFSDMKLFEKFYTEMAKYKINTGFFALNSYRNILYADKINEIMNEFREIMCASNGQKIETKILVRPLIKGVLTNIKETTKAVPLQELGKIYQGKTALIVSAGPTLDSNIETIKKNRDKVIIFCVGQALKALNSKGIKPDFLAILEYKDCTNQVKGVDLSDINLIVAPYTHYFTYLLDVKKKFLFPAQDASATEFWSSFTGYDFSSYDVKGTVSYMAMASAQMLGCSKIILVGQDLAYINNQCYSKGSAYAGLVFETDSKTQEIKFKIEDEEKYAESCSSMFEGKVNGSLLSYSGKDFANGKLSGTQLNLDYIKGITGDMLPTLSGYGLFVDYFNEFAEEHKELNLINTSLVGAQIDGFKNISLEKALENDSVFDRVDASKVPVSFKYNEKKILQKLEEYSKILKVALSDLKKGECIVTELENILEEKNLLTDEALKIEAEIKKLFNITTNIPSTKSSLVAYEEYIKAQCLEYSEILNLKLKCIQNVVPIYLKIKQEQQSVFYKTLAYSEDLEVQFILEDAEELTPTEIIITYSALKDYFYNVRKECSVAIAIIDKQSSEFNFQAFGKV